MTEPAATGGPERRDPPFPRVPAYAWTWLQRSRPVLVEAARRLTGAAPERDFVERLQRSFAEDPFVRDVLVDVIADVAFNGRVPTRRPVGAPWDRGLIWWAAALAGTTPAEFERRGAEDPASQHRLFDVPGAAGAGQAAALHRGAGRRRGRAPPPGRRPAPAARERRGRCRPGERAAPAPRRARAGHRRLIEVVRPATSH